MRKMQALNSPIRKNPIPCKICGALFSGATYIRKNCDLHFGQLTIEEQKRVSNLIRKQKLGSKRAPFSKEWKAKMSASAQHGAKCHRWKGGVTPIHKKIRKSSKYVNWRKQVYERDDYTCQLCGVRGGELQADHIKPFSLFPDLRFELSNGRTLCKPCHRKTPTYGDLRYYATQPS